MAVVGVLFVPDLTLQITHSGSIDQTDPANFPTTMTRPGS
jgi:hypothetical protein